MRVLFVSSGNNKRMSIAPFIFAQGESVKKEGVELDYFLIKGKTVLEYVKNVPRLRAHIKAGNYDVVHAHFVLSGWVALLTFSGKPLMLSFLGTDVLGRLRAPGKVSLKSRYLTLLSLLIQPFVDAVISKSPNIQRYVYVNHKSYLIPNGVDLEKFYCSQSDFRQELDLKPNQKYLLFMGNTEDKNKNFQLVDAARQKLLAAGIEIVAPYPVPHDRVFKYLNSVNALAMTSFSEGSPNIVKEAMACNCKGVFADVGDVRYLVDSTKGYKVTSYDVDDFCRNVIDVIHAEECEGRKRIEALKLDERSVALRIIDIYNRAIS
jgi:teichuronic acid biosynthesis glycosyltransferase TuaC